MSRRLEGKVSIITGAGSGLGEATALRFADEGAAVVVADVNGEGAERVAAQIRSAGGDALGVEVDVADLAATEALAQTALGRWGRIDTMYANAAISPPETALSCTPDVWATVIAVNLTGVWHSVRAVLPAMIEARSGSIILQASGAALTGVSGTFPYTASKGGVVAIGRQLATEYGPDNIRVNTISPGSVWTPLNQRTYEERTRLGQYASVEEGKQMSAQRLPLRRFGDPEDNAALALFFASDESAWITGVVVPMDGGLTASSGLVPPPPPTAR